VNSGTILFCPECGAAATHAKREKARELMERHMWTHGLPAVADWLRATYLRTKGERRKHGAGHKGYLQVARQAGSDSCP
jgi:hypothetical protein